jgi:glycosyltransferase involved in cell wall biosynthesis
LRRLRPNVVYQRVGCAYTGIAAFYARRAGCRLVWHAASDADLQINLKVRQRNFIRQRLERSLLSYGIRSADRIVTQTEQQARLLRENFGRRPDAVIANFHPDPTETIDKSGPLRVVWIADLKRLKQPEAFLRLAEALQDIHDIRFVMIGAATAGAGDASWQASLKERLNSASNLEYLGQLSQAEVNEQLAKAHVFVNTSIYEGFPNTFIQAWLRDAAVVSLNVDPDGILNRDNLGFHAGTEARLAEIVRRLISDSALRAAIAQRARAHAKRFHSMENARRLEEIIRGAAVKSVARQG